MNTKIASSNNITVLSHPLLQHKLSLMRKKETDCQKFRELLSEIASLIAFEVTKNAPIVKQMIETPLQPMEAPFVTEQVILVSILRAGNGLLDGMIKMIPNASVGHIGIYRDPKTLEAVEYYFKMPPVVSNKRIILVDPMLATGHSASAAIARLKKSDCQKIQFACLLAAPEGIQILQKEHPEVHIYTVAIDEALNDKGYILPGLGDAGDRIYRTK